MLGGYSNVKDADSEIQALVDQVKSSVESKTGKTYSEFKAVKYSSQVVAGMNYKVKVHVGGNDYIHVLVFRGLDQSVSVTSVEEGKTESDGF